MVNARRKISPSWRMLNPSDQRSRADVASCSTQLCVQSIDTIDGMRSMRSRLAYAVAWRWK
jgi:hypothetical protein